MTDDYDIKLKTLFDQARIDLRAEEFTAQVLDSIQRRQQLDALLRYTGALALLALFWLITPQLEYFVLQLNTGLEGLIIMAVNLLQTVALSPLTYLYAGALLVYLLIRYRIRLL